MNRTLAGLAFVVVLSAASASDLNAQTVATGTWTGTVTPPDGQITDVQYTVATVGDTLQISLNIPNGPSFPFSNIRLDKGNLLFSWSPDVTIDCSLAQQKDGSFQGDCTDKRGVTGQLAMVPPR